MNTLKLTDQCLCEMEGLLELVQNEHIHQLQKWGVQTETPEKWMMYTTEELGELAMAITEFQRGNDTKEHVVREAIQVATLALKIAEMFLVLEEDEK